MNLYSSIDYDGLPGNLLIVPSELRQIMARIAQRFLAPRQLQHVVGQCDVKVGYYVDGDNAEPLGLERTHMARVDDIERLGRLVADGRAVAVEIKRIATIEAVEQLSRYLELIRLDPARAACRGTWSPLKNRCPSKACARYCPLLAARLSQRTACRVSLGTPSPSR